MIIVCKDRWLYRAGETWTLDNKPWTLDLEISLFLQLFCIPCSLLRSSFSFFQFLLKADLVPFSHQMKNTCRVLSVLVFPFPLLFLFFLFFVEKERQDSSLLCKGWICHAVFYRIQLNISLLSNTAGGQILLT